MLSLRLGLLYGFRLTSTFGLSISLSLRLLLTLDFDWHVFNYVWKLGQICKGTEKFSLATPLFFIL